MPGIHVPLISVCTCVLQQKDRSRCRVNSGHKAQEGLCPAEVVCLAQANPLCVGHSDRLGSGLWGQGPEGSLRRAGGMEDGTLRHGPSSEGEGRQREVWRPAQGIRAALGAGGRPEGAHCVHCCKNRNRKGHESQSPHLWGRRWYTLCKTKNPNLTEAKCRRSSRQSHQLSPGPPEPLSPCQGSSGAALG